VSRRTMLTQDGVPFQRRRVNADGLPLEQACSGQSLQHPGEHC
jgi:hypothetical protein